MRGKVSHILRMLFVVESLRPLGLQGSSDQGCKPPGSGRSALLVKNRLVAQVEVPCW